jgi:type IV secretion system protein VirD4
VTSGPAHTPVHRPGPVRPPSQTTRAPPTKACKETATLQRSTNPTSGPRGRSLDPLLPLGEHGPAAEQGDFTPERLLSHGGTLCIVTPNAEGDRFAPYFTALLSAIIHTAETAAAEGGGPIEPRLLLALDEAGNVFRYPRLPNLLTTARGNGIQLLLIFHDLAQVEHLYGGREVARTVMSNAKMRMLLPGVADIDTLRYWSDLTGHTRTETTGTTTGFDGKRSRSRNEHSDHLAPLHKLQQLPAGQAVLLYENLPPARVLLLPWYNDRRFRYLKAKP